MSQVNFIVVIPARFDSERLYGKALLNLNGKSLIEHVYCAALKSDAKGILIATDSNQIKEVTENFDAKTIMTKKTHASGTDRINEVAELECWEEDQIIVNLQGDSPLMPAENINQVAQLLFDRPDAGIATLATKILDPQELEDPNVVKVEFDKSGRANSFDRKVESKNNQMYWRHLGIYAYRVGTLKSFSQHERSEEEVAARLEQLRAFDLNIEIVIQEASIIPGPEVDTESDLNVVRAIMAKH